MDATRKEEIYRRMFERAAAVFPELHLQRHGDGWRGPVKLDGSEPHESRPDKVVLDGGEHLGRILEQGGPTVSYWDYLAAREGLTEPAEIAQYLEETAGLAPENPRPTSRPRNVAARPTAQPARPGAFSDIYNALLDMGQDVDTMPPGPRDYLVKERGFSPDVLRTWRVRYYPPDQRQGILHTMQERFQENELKGAGLLAPGKDGKGDYYHFQYVSFLFPFLGNGGQVLHIQGRKWPGGDGEKTSKSLYPRTREAKAAGLPYSPIPELYGGWNFNSLPPGATVHLVEGIPDTLTAASLGLNAAGFPSTAAIKQHGPQAYAARLRGFRVCFIPDDDPPEPDGRPGAGARFAVDVVNALRGQVAGLSLLPVPEGYKDLNEYRRENMDKSNQEIVDTLTAGAINPADVVPPERVPLENMPYSELIRHESEKAQTRGAGIAGLYLGDPAPYEEDAHTGRNPFTRNFPALQEAIDGVQAGFYIIAADSNVGKTALLVNLCLAILEYNESVHCLFFSLDDSRLKIHRRLLTRLLAPTLGVKIQNVGKRLGEADQAKREAAENRLLDWYESGRLDIPALDGESITAAIEKRIHEELERIGGAGDDPQERPRLVVFIDGLHYLDTPDEKGNPSETQEEKAQAEKVKEWVNRYNLPVITTAELRKKDKRGAGKNDKGFTWPTMQDIAGSRRFAYRADLVLMVWADSAQATREKDIYTIRMMPDKNKLGPGKNPIRAAFDRYRVRIIEDKATGPERKDADIDRAIREQKEKEKREDDKKKRTAKESGGGPQDAYKKG